jgi:hypothetical protein
MNEVSIDVGRIEKVRRVGDSWIGRCPACGEAGADRTGVHLRVWADGRFACVVNPGKEGAAHRKRIFALVGSKAGGVRQTVYVRKVTMPWIKGMGVRP